MKTKLKLTVAVAAELLLVVLGYFAAAAAMTWPTAAHLDEIVLGGGELGGWLWRYWWHFVEAEALGQADLSFVERWSALVALGRHPETGNILDVLFLSWPLHAIIGFPAHYNVKVLLILTLNGLCGYALARYYVRGRMVAFAAGLVAVVNPLNIQDINGSGLRQCLLWWLLLYPIFLDRAAKRQSIPDAAVAGLCMGLSAAWYWFYGLFAALYTLIYLAWHLGARRISWRGILRWLLPLGVATLLVAWPFVRPYMNATEQGMTALPEMSFFLPFPRYETIAEAPMRPETYEENVLASLHRTIRSSWAADYLFRPTSERTMPIVVLLLGAIPVLLRRQRLFWLAVFLFFYSASLGPFLKLNTLQDASQVLIFNDTWVVRMPFTWLFRWVPGMSRLFGPYRLAAMVMVASVALLALGLDSLPASSRTGRWIKRLVCLLVVVATMLQVSYRFKVDHVAEGSYQPSRWRAPTKVSRIDVPPFYGDLDPDRLEGLIELPLGREQDLLCYYQVVHRQKVYRSWATSGAVPTVLTKRGGGELGERMRYLVSQLPLDFPGAAELEAISRLPEEVPIETLTRQALGSLIKAGNFRYMLVHERGYYLVNPYDGPLLYRDAVRRLSAGLDIEPREVIEHSWTDYPGNRYNVPNGPVYIPWSAEEINLPDKEMPRKLYMSIFDLSPLLDAEPAEEPAEEPVGETAEPANIDKALPLP